MPKIFKFNETCCEGKGVPEECMGLCREVDETMTRREISMQRECRSIDTYPVDRCVQHQDNIRSCLYQYGNEYAYINKLMRLQIKSYLH